MTVRVLRLLEYIYPDYDTAVADMQRWQVQVVYAPNPRTLIRSTVLPPLSILAMREKEAETEFEIGPLVQQKGTQEAAWAAVEEVMADDDDDNDEIPERDDGSDNPDYVEASNPDR